MPKKKTAKKPLTKNSLEKLTHDLRTPISVIRMTIDVFELSKDKKSKKVKDLIKTINKQSEALLQIIQHFES